MIAGQVYEATQPSGVDSLGKVPAHWAVKRLRRVATVRNSNVDKLTKRGEERVRLCNYTDVYKRPLIRADDPFMEATATKDEIDAFRLRVGDVIITKDSEDWQDIGVPAYVASTADDLVCGYHLTVLRSRSDAIVGRFLYWLLRATELRREFSIAARGVTRYGLTLVGMKNIPILVPPPDEQAAIVRFLDHSVGRLDRAIAAKRRVVRLLEEQKRAAIHRAVTSGLDPSAPMKDSGAPWPGEVPERWKKIRLGSVARVGNGSTPSRGKPYYWKNGTIPWLNSSVANQDEVESSDQFVTSAALAECHLPMIRAGSLLMAITGQGKTRGKVTRVLFDTTVNQHLAFIDLRVPDLRVAFVQQVLAAQYNDLRRMSDDSGSTKGAITCADIRSIRIFAPLDVEEQDEIVASIDRDTSHLQRMMREIEEEIVLFEEYRTALISEVVTGKRDVRAAAAALPEAPPPADDPLDFDAGEDDLEEALMEEAPD